MFKLRLTYNYIPPDRCFQGQTMRVNFFLFLHFWQTSFFLRFLRNFLFWQNFCVFFTFLMKLFFFYESLGFLTKLFFLRTQRHFFLAFSTKHIFLRFWRNFFCFMFLTKLSVFTFLTKLCFFLRFEQNNCSFYVLTYFFFWQDLFF